MGAQALRGPVFAVARDNSPTAEARRELDAAREEVAASEIAKSRFLAAVSHELRTPLNTIIGFSDMMLQEIGGPIGEARRREYVGLIRESGNHLLAVVNAILDVSKIESGAYDVRLEPFALADAVELCRSMMAPQAEAKQVGLETRVADDLGEVMGDRRAVQQILLNLVSNAVKFTPVAGQGERRSAGAAATRPCSRCPIPASALPRAISRDWASPSCRFRTTLTRQYEGTGLGLALVKGLVKLHHGEMAIESAPGEGTTVTVVLPAGARHPAAIEEARRQLPRRRSSRSIR